MKFTAIIVLGLAALAQANIIIESPQETNWGTWGPWSRCPFGTYAQAIQVKTEPFQGTLPHQDDTAVNGFRLYCGDPTNSSTIFITSTVQEWGNWGTTYTCRSDDRPLPPDGFVTGFQLRSESNLGPADDSAANNIRIFCNYPGTSYPEQTKEADGLTFGHWTSFRKCNFNQAVCALQTQVEGYQGDGDDSALNNLRMECCDRQ